MSSVWITADLWLTLYMSSVNFGILEQSRVGVSMCAVACKDFRTLILYSVKKNSTPIWRRSSALCELIGSGITMCVEIWFRFTYFLTVPEQYFCYNFYERKMKRSWVVLVLVLMLYECVSDMFDGLIRYGKGGSFLPQIWYIIALKASQDLLTTLGDRRIRAILLQVEDESAWRWLPLIHTTRLLPILPAACSPRIWQQTGKNFHFFSDCKSTRRKLVSTLPAWFESMPEDWSVVVSLQ